MLQGSSGFYCYGIYEKLKEWPGFNLPQTRIVFKLSKDWYGIALPQIGLCLLLFRYVCTMKSMSIQLHKKETQS